MWKYLIAWAPMVAIAVANGLVREAWYGRRVSELRAHQISTASGVLLLGAYMWVIIRLWPPESLKEAFAVGLIWLALTVTFELYSAITSPVIHEVASFVTTMSSPGGSGCSFSSGLRSRPMYSFGCSGSDPHMWPHPAFGQTR